MRLCDLSSVKRWLPENPTAADPLWRREAASVSDMDIQLFYARASVKGRRLAAINAIDTLQAGVIAACFNQEMTEAPGAIMHQPPPVPYMVDELVDGLSKLRPSRRQACLFALETNNPPEVASLMTWRHAITLRQTSPLTREIIEAAGRTRHLRLPYLFWEWATPVIATPLLELQWSIEQAFDCTWPQLVDQYSRIAQIDRGAECESFLALAL